MVAYTALACRCIIGLVFAISAYSKLSSRRSFAEFTATVRAVPWLPRRALVAAPIATGVVVAEAAVSLAMVANLTVQVGFLLAAALLTAFVGLIVSLIRGRSAVPCRCFGPSRKPLGPAHIARNILLLAVATAGLWAHQSATGTSVHPAGVLIAIVAALVLASLLVLFDDLVALFTVS